MKHHFLYLVASLSSLTTTGSSTPGIIPASQYPNIIVIADMHGDAEALLLSLYAGYVKVVRSSSIGEDSKPVSFAEFSERFDSVIELNQTHAPKSPLWTQKNVALVQLGDLVDRGKFSLKCLVIMRAVRAVVGFEVFQILGNHELAPAIDSSFLFQRYRHPLDDLNWGLDPKLIQRPDGVLYKEIIHRFMPMVRLDGGENRNISTLFVHAAVHMEFIMDLLGLPLPTDPNELVRSINKAIREDLMSPSVSSDALLMTYFDENTIFTSREYMKKFPSCGEIEIVLNLFQVSRIVVGHMADAKTHRARNLYCNNQPVIVLADIAASRYMYGFDSDKKFPSPGAVVMKINPLSNTLEYMEGVYSNFWGALLSDPPQSLIAPLFDPSISVSDIRRLGPIIVQDELVKIVAFETTDRDGFILHFTERGAELMKPGLELLEEIRDGGGIFPDSFPKFERVVFLDSKVLFIHSPRSDKQFPLYLFSQPMTENICVQMDDIITFLTDEEICTGLIRDATKSQLVDTNGVRNYFKSLFVFSEDGETVTFVNFSRLHPCSKQHAKEELRVFYDSFKEELDL